MTACRNTKQLPQKELAEAFVNSHATIDKYEGDEMVSSMDAAKKLTRVLNTSVRYLWGENEAANLFKAPKMLQRFQDISVLPEKEKECLLSKHNT